MTAYCENRIGKTMANSVTVKDIIAAKAIRCGYNPYCRSTDADARRVTEEMKRRAESIRIPEEDRRVKRTANAAEHRPMIREVRPAAPKPAVHREVVSLENFELVKKESSAFSFGMLISVMICALVLAAVVYSGSLINEEAREYAELSQTLESLRKDNQALTLELEAKNDLAVIEDIAKNDLGMVKVADAEQKYVSLSDGDEIRAYAAEEQDTKFGTSLLNAFGEKISKFLEYLD